LANYEILRNPKQRKLLLNAGFSWMFDAMDVGMVSFVVAALALQWKLSPQQIGAVNSISSIGMAVGAAVAGLLADRYGRKNVLMWTLLLFSAASGLSALAMSFGVLCVLRFIAGVGLGGELPVASTLISESVSAEDRGRAVVFLESFWALGWIASALIAYFIIPDFGWRIAFAIGALPALYTLYLRRSIEDPPRFQRQQSKSRSRSGGSSYLSKIAGVWARPHLRSTVMLWILWFTVVYSYYGMFLWLPTVMVLKGFGLVKGFQYTLIMTLSQLPGYLTAAYFIEKFGRKFVLSSYLIATAASAAWFGAAETPGMLIAAGMSLSFFNLGAWGALYAYTPEQYPTSIRTTGVGLAASFGRIGGILAPLIVGLLVGRGTDISTIFMMFFVTVLIGAFVVIALGRETKGEQLAD
jgi:MFS transporter, putative metabolite:H+ symporter